jgi:hypothetical protein
LGIVRVAESELEPNEKVDILSSGPNNLLKLLQLETIK